MDPTLDLDESVTVTRINLQGEKCYLMIGWLSDSFEMHLYMNDKLWKGVFTSNRLSGFSKNLNKTQSEYLKSVKACFRQERNDYFYELKSGFFYWRKILKNGSYLIEGFLPMELDNSLKDKRQTLIDALLALNLHMKGKIDKLNLKYNSLKSDYHKCLDDTTEFLNLKIEMEKALSEKFLNLLKVQKAKVEAIDGSNNNYGMIKRIWRELSTTR